MKMNLKNTSLLSLLAGLVLMTGCQTVPYQGQARDVKRKPQQEGIVSIPLDSRPEDRTKAEERMKTNCAPLTVKVLQEEEVAVGQEVKSSAKETDRASSESQVGKLFGIPLMTGEAGGRDTASSSVTTAIKEWQISYKCEGGTKIR
jgi:hypothetical protein